MRKPKVTIKCVAESYNRGRDDSRIIEFMDRDIKQGGLIEFRRDGDQLRVICYALDRNVKVSAGNSHLVPYITNHAKAAGA